METQVIINMAGGLWLLILSFLGFSHYRRDRIFYDEMLDLIQSLHDTLDELRAEIDRGRVNGES